MATMTATSSSTLPMMMKFGYDNVTDRTSINQTLSGADYSEERLFQAVYLGYLWTALIIGLPGNVLIAIVYIVVKQKRTSDWFIFFLSVYDCAVCVFAVPLYLSIETGAWMKTGSDLACKIEQFTIFTAQFSSVSVLGIIAVDRYLKICHPTKRSLNATQARNLGMCTPLVSAVVAAPILVWDGNVERRFCRVQEEYKRTLGVKFHLCLTFGFFICMFLIVIFCYSHVCFVVKRRMRRHRENALKRKHLMQIPAFLQAISNVDDLHGLSSNQNNRNKKRFSLFSIGSSRRLSAISPWIKARLSLPSDNSGRKLALPPDEIELTTKNSLVDIKRQLDQALMFRAKSSTIGEFPNDKNDVFKNESEYCDSIKQEMKRKETTRYVEQSNRTRGDFNHVGNVGGNNDKNIKETSISSSTNCYQFAPEDGSRTNQENVNPGQHSIIPIQIDPMHCFNCGDSQNIIPTVPHKDNKEIRCAASVTLLNSAEYSNCQRLLFDKAVSPNNYSFNSNKQRGICYTNSPLTDTSLNTGCVDSPESVHIISEPNSNKNVKSISKNCTRDYVTMDNIKTPVSEDNVFKEVNNEDGTCLSTNECVVGVNFHNCVPSQAICQTYVPSYNSGECVHGQSECKILGWNRLENADLSCSNAYEANKHSATGSVGCSDSSLFARRKNPFLKRKLFNEVGLNIKYKCSFCHFSLKCRAHRSEPDLTGFNQGKCHSDSNLCMGSGTSAHKPEDTSHRKLGVSSVEDIVSQPGNIFRGGYSHRQIIQSCTEKTDFVTPQEQQNALCLDYSKSHGHCTTCLNHQLRQSRKTRCEVTETKKCRHDKDNTGYVQAVVKLERSQKQSNKRPTRLQENKHLYGVLDHEVDDPCVNNVTSALLTKSKNRPWRSLQNVIEVGVSKLTNIHSNSTGSIPENCAAIGEPITGKGENSIAKIIRTKTKLKNRLNKFHSQDASVSSGVFESRAYNNESNLDMETPLLLSRSTKNVNFKLRNKHRPACPGITGNSERLPHCMLNLTATQGCACDCHQYNLQPTEPTALDDMFKQDHIEHQGLQSCNKCMEIKSTVCARKVLNDEFRKISMNLQSSYPCLVDENLCNVDKRTDRTVDNMKNSDTKDGRIPPLNTFDPTPYSELSATQKTGASLRENECTTYATTSSSCSLTDRALVGNNPASCSLTDRALVGNNPASCSLTDRALVGNNPASCSLTDQALVGNNPASCSLTDRALVGNNPASCSLTDRALVGNNPASCSLTDRALVGNNPASCSLTDRALFGNNPASCNVRYHTGIDGSCSKTSSVDLKQTVSPIQILHPCTNISPHYATNVGQTAMDYANSHHEDGSTGTSGEIFSHTNRHILSLVPTDGSPVIDIPSSGGNCNSTNFIVSCATPSLKECETETLYNRVPEAQGRLSPYEVKHYPLIECKCVSSNPLGRPSELCRGLDFERKGTTECDCCNNCCFYYKQADMNREQNKVDKCALKACSSQHEDVIYKRQAPRLCLDNVPRPSYINNSNESIYQGIATSDRESFNSPSSHPHVTTSNMESFNSPSPHPHVTPPDREYFNSPSPHPHVTPPDRESFNSPSPHPHVTTPEIKLFNSPLPYPQVATTEMESFNSHSSHPNGATPDKDSYKSSSPHTPVAKSDCDSYKSSSPHTPVAKSDCDSYKSSSPHTPVAKSDCDSYKSSSPHTPVAKSDCDSYKSSSPHTPVAKSDCDSYKSSSPHLLERTTDLNSVCSECNKLIMQETNQSESSPHKLGTDIRIVPSEISHDTPHQFNSTCLLRESESSPHKLGTDIRIVPSEISHDTPHQFNSTCLLHESESSPHKLGTDIRIVPSEISHDTPHQFNSTCLLHESESSPHKLGTDIRIVPSEISHDTPHQFNSTCLLHESESSPHKLGTDIRIVPSEISHDTPHQFNSTCLLHESESSPHKLGTDIRIVPSEISHDTPHQFNSICLLHESESSPHKLGTDIRIVPSEISHDTPPQFNSTCLLHESESSPHKLGTDIRIMPSEISHDTPHQFNSTCLLHESESSPHKLGTDIRIVPSEISHDTPHQFNSTCLLHESEEVSNYNRILELQIESLRACNKNEVTLFHERRICSNCWNKQHQDTNFPVILRNQNDQSQIYYYTEHQENISLCPNRLLCANRLLCTENNDVSGAGTTNVARLPFLPDKTQGPEISQICVNSSKYYPGPAVEDDKHDVYEINNHVHHLDSFRCDECFLAGFKNVLPEEDSFLLKNISETIIKTKLTGIIRAIYVSHAIASFRRNVNYEICEHLNQFTSDQITGLIFSPYLHLSSEKSPSFLISNGIWNISDKQNVNAQSTSTLFSHFSLVPSCFLCNSIPFYLRSNRHELNCFAVNYKIVETTTHSEPIVTEYYDTKDYTIDTEFTWESWQDICSPTITDHIGDYNVSTGLFNWKYFGYLIFNGGFTRFPCPFCFSSIELLDSSVFLNSCTCSLQLFQPNMADHDKWPSGIGSNRSGQKSMTEAELPDVVYGACADKGWNEIVCCRNMELFKHGHDNSLINFETRKLLKQYSHQIQRQKGTGLPGNICRTHETCVKFGGRSSETSEIDNSNSNEDVCDEDHSVKHVCCFVEMRSEDKVSEMSQCRAASGNIFQDMKSDKQTNIRQSQQSCLDQGHEKTLCNNPCLRNDVSSKNADNSPRMRDVNKTDFELHCTLGNKSDAINLSQNVNTGTTINVNQIMFTLPFTSCKDDWVAQSDETTAIEHNYLEQPMLTSTSYVLRPNDRLRQFKLASSNIVNHALHSLVPLAVGSNKSATEKTENEHATHFDAHIMSPHLNESSTDADSYAGIDSPDIGREINSNKNSSQENCSMNKNVIDTTKGIHSILLGCVPTFKVDEAEIKSSLSDMAVPNSDTCEFFVQTVFDSFFSRSPYSFKSDPCLNAMDIEYASSELMDFPMSPLLCSNVEDNQDNPKKHNDSSVFHIAGNSRKKLSTGFDFNEACVRKMRSPKRNGSAQSWFSLDDLSGQPASSRHASMVFLSSLRRQLNSVLSPKSIRQFFGVNEAHNTKNSGKRAQMPRDTLTANQINVIITRCDSLVLDKRHEMGLPPIRDRASTFDPSVDKPTRCTYESPHSFSGTRQAMEGTTKPRACSLDTSFSSNTHSDDPSLLCRSQDLSLDRSRGASLDLLSPTSASFRTGSMCSGISSLSKMTECSAYTEHSRSDCEKITRRTAEREHNITKLLGVITIMFVISWSVSWSVILIDILTLVPVTDMLTTNVTLSIARNLFLVNHFCNILVYAVLSKSFREKMSQCYKNCLHCCSF